MKIESKIQREGGSHIPMGSVTYHFAPLPDGAHVADVHDEAHQDRFLSIAEGFRLYRGAEIVAPVAMTEPAQTPAQEPAEPSVGALAMSTEHDPEYTIHGNVISLVKITEMAYEESRLTVELWNEQEPVVIADRTDQMLDKLAERLAPKTETPPPPPPPPAEEAPALDREKLVLEYVAMFAKKPHHKWSAEKIRDELKA